MPRRIQRISSDFRQPRPSSILTLLLSGELARRTNDTLSFHVKRHAANKLHFDLRLEFEGRFLTFAARGGPALGLKNERIAVEIDDHPLACAGFEGVIPYGNGSGVVQSWDEGRWTFHPNERTNSGSLCLVFTLQGQRLKGKFELQFKREAAYPEWILRKSEDEGVSEHNLWEETTSIHTGRSFEEILRDEFPPNWYYTPPKKWSNTDNVLFEIIAAVKRDIPQPPLPRVKPIPKPKKPDDDDDGQGLLFDL